MEGHQKLAELSSDVPDAQEMTLEKRIEAARKTFALGIEFLSVLGQTSVVRTFMQRGLLTATPVSRDDLVEDLDKVVELASPELVHVMNVVVNQSPRVMGYVAGMLVYEALESVAVTAVTGGLGAAFKGPQALVKIATRLERLDDFKDVATKLKASALKRIEQERRIARAVEAVDNAKNGAMLAGRTDGSRFTGKLGNVFKDLREIAPGVRFDYKEFGDSKLLGEFDDVNNIIYFQRGRSVGVVTLADEMQHALDFAETGLTRAQIIEQISRVHKIGPNAAYSWYHRRIFTRAIKNIHDGKPGFAHLKDHVGEIYDAYLGHGGNLTMKEIIDSTFDGLF